MKKETVQKENIYLCVLNLIALTFVLLFTDLVYVTAKLKICSAHCFMMGISLTSKKRHLIRDN